MATLVKTQKEASVVRPFGWSDKIGYLLGDFGCNMSFSLITGYMMLFFTQYIGISLVHYATIILFTKIWDGINDPIVGVIVDRYKPRAGDKLRPWIKWGSFPLAISAALLFFDTSHWGVNYYWAKIAVCVVGYLIWDIAYTIVNVPYGSMNSTITADAVERSQLSTFRSFGAILAALPISVIIPQIVYRKEEINGMTQSIFQGHNMFGLALGMGFIALIAFQMLYRMVTERIQHNEHEEVKINYFKTLKEFVTNRATLGLTILNLTQLVFIFSTQSTAALVFQMYFGNGSLSSLVALTMLVPMLVTAPLVKPMVKKYGKKEISYYPMFGTMIVFAIMLIVPIRNPFIFTGLLTLAMTFSGFWMLVGWAMVSDGIDMLELKTGRREEGTVYATFSLIRKLAQGIGQALVPLLIAIIIPGLVMNDPGTWSQDYGTQIKNLSIALPLIGTIISLITFAFIYNLDKKSVDDMQRRLGRAPLE